MKKNLFSMKKPKWGLIALFMTFSCLFTNLAIGQQAIFTAAQTGDVLVWSGNVSSEWNNPGNWYVNVRATTPGTSLYPGQVELDDWVFIPSTSAGGNAPIIPAGQTYQIARLYVTNQFNAAGGLLTIDAGGTLNVVNNASNTVVLGGGSIVNNGALNISSTAVGFSGFPAYGINCINPNTLPAIPTEWGYSGNGALSINLSAANFAGAAAIAVTGNSGATTTPTNNANVTYRMVLNNPTITYNQGTSLGIAAFRGASGNNANKLIIAGTGATIGSAGSPYIGSLIGLGAGGSITVDSGTTLTLHASSVATNLNAGIAGFSTNANPTNLTNRGTINILGSQSVRGGIQLSTGSSAVASVYNITNEGILNVNMNITGVGLSAFNIGNGGGGSANAGSVVNFNNTSTGSITFKNTSTTPGTGFAIFGTTAGEAPRTIFTNDGVINLEGTTYNFGTKMTVNNNATINTNSEFRSFSAINNNAGGSINFVRTAATASTKQVTFNGIATTAAAALGAIYSDGTNQYTVISQKFNTFGTTLITNTLASSDTALLSTTSGSITKVSGTGDTSITYSETAAVVEPPAAYIPSFSASSANGALTTGTTNSGTINTDTGSVYLNSLSGVSATSSTSIIAPGGSGKGIADFNRFSWVSLYGTAKIQVSGNATAGVDYDQLNNSVQYGGLDVTNATLDVSGIYTPSGTLASPIDIMSTGTNAPLVGTFATVTGLTPGWSVNYTAPVGETIDPITSLPYVPARRDNGKVQLTYVQTPYITQLSSNGTDTITQGCEGSTLVILGSKFTGATAVTVNGVPLTGVTVVSDTRIDAVLPMGATSGLVAVTGPEAVGSSAGNFEVIAYSTNTTPVTSFLTYTWANNGQTYNASGIYTGTTSANCVTELLDLTITTTQIPASFPAFCKGATVATATAGTGMVFYAAATGGLPLAGTTALGNAKTYWVTEVINSVETPTRLARLITVNNLPATPTTVASNPIGESKLICKYIGSSTPVTFDVVATGAVSYQWTVPAGASVVSGDTTSSVGVSFAGASTVAGVIGAVVVRSVDANGCVSLPKSLSITTKLPTAPTSLVMTSEDSTPHFDVITTPAVIGVSPAIISTVGLNYLTKITKVGPYMGTTTEFKLTAPVAPTAASYEWTLPAGVNQLTGGTSNEITVNFAGVTSGIGALPIVVKSVGGCGLSTARTLTLGRVVPGAPKALVLTCSNTTPRFSGAKDPLTGIAPLVGLNTLTKITKVGPYQSTTIGFTLTATPFMVQGATATSYAWILPANVVCTSSNTPTTVYQNVNTGTVEAPVIVSTPFAAIKTTTNTINILFNTTGTGNLDLLVFGVNGAGNSVARKLVVTRSLPTAPTKLVLTDNAISSTVPVTKVGPYIGKTTVLNLTGTPFTTQGAEGRTFHWVLPAGVNVLSGATLLTDNGDTKTWTSSFSASSSGMNLTVDFANVLAPVAPSTTLTLPMSVNAINLAGTSATVRSLTVTAAAPTPPVILGSGGEGLATEFSVCSQKTYTATPFLGATYTWTVPAGATFTQTGNSILVDYTATSVALAKTGAVTCVATNGVGSSAVKSYTVKRIAGSCRDAASTIENEFNVVAFPNPSSSEFNIETSTKVGAISVKVYDMQGRLVEKSNTEKVGSKLAAGTYNVIVNQGTKSKSVRVIKK